MTQTCVQHPNVLALYVCDGCQKHLCGACIEESHALLLCRLCGERALPLHAGQAASVRELRKQEVMTAPYSLVDALTYPFRGSGLFMFAAVLIISGILWFMSFFAGCAALILQVILWGLIVGLQFKIVRSTAEGENELPDWPDFTEVWRLVQDFLTWLVIHAVPVMILLWFVFQGVAQGLENVDFAPRLDFWLGVALCLWLSAAFVVMAYGAVGTYRRLKVFEVHNHVRGYLTAGADAVRITNLTFGLGALAFLLRSFLEAIPFVGQALGSVVGVYWIFIVPHLAGLLFRRHSDAMEKLYWADRGLGY